MSKLTDQIKNFREGQAQRDEDRREAGLPTSSDVLGAVVGIIAPKPSPADRRYKVAPAVAAQPATQGLGAGALLALGLVGAALVMRKGR